MRFFISGEWSRNRLLQTIVVLYAFYVGLLWITNGLLYFDVMGLTPSSVVDHYLGNEEAYRPPRSYQGLLEVSHFHLFAMGMLLLVLTHLMLFVPIRNSTKAWLIVIPFFSAFLDEGAGWLDQREQLIEERECVAQPSVGAASDLLEDTRPRVQPFELRDLDQPPGDDGLGDG